MILLQANHISKHYDIHDVLFDANLSIQSGDRVALVGPNGAGKSTLLRIVVNEEEPSTGDVSIAKGASLGYIAQFVDYDEETTVFAYVAATFKELYAMEQKLRSLEQQMANPDIYESEKAFGTLTAEYDQLQHQFNQAGGYGVDARVRRVLDGLQFPVPLHQRTVSSLSGGQKTRLSLARLLVWEPDILVLDEPTNYLDTDTITWLENYLAGYQGALLMVSHDRYFLDKVATVVYELENGSTTRYVGNYSDYVEAKAARFDQELKHYEAQQKEIQKMETFIQKNIVRATTTKRAQSRRKMLERMVRMERPSDSTPTLALRFTPKRESGKDVLLVDGLRVGYPGKTLPGPLDLRIARGDRIALLGPNGIGKSTFLKALVGRLPVLAGSFRWGQHVALGYYDQEQTDLHPEKTVLSEVWDEYPSLDMTTIRTALGRFLFRGEDVTKPVSSLSGGERSRLSLCKLMLEQSNVLVMDEPTNHLDLMSKEVLEDALADFEGTLIFVSHDRYFIDALATKVVTLDEHGFRTYLGNYTEYMQKRADEEKWSAVDASDGGTGIRNASRPGQLSSTSAEPVTNASPIHSTGKPARSDQNSSSPTRSHVRSADLRKLRDKVAELEATIVKLETQHQETGEELTAASIANDADRARDLQVVLADLEQQLENSVAEWERVAAELEVLEALARE